MNEKIFSGFGVEIFQRDGRFFIQYDAGEIAVQMCEQEVTEEEAVKAQKSEKDAYEVILASKHRQ